MPVFRDRSSRTEFFTLSGDDSTQIQFLRGNNLWGGFRAEAAWSQLDLASAGNSGLPANYQPVESAWYIPGPTAIIDTYAPTPSTTGTLVVDDPNHVLAACDVPGDNDWFAVTLTAGVTYQFGQYAYAGGAVGITESNDVPLADAYLEIYDSTGTNLLAIADGGGPNTPSGLDALMTFTAPTSGTYYVNATSYDNDGDGIGDFAGDYEIFAITATAGTVYTTPYDIASPLHSIDWGGVMVNREHVSVRNPDGMEGPRPTGEPAANPALVEGNTLGFPGKNVIYIYFAGEGDLYANADSTIPAQVTAQDPYQYEIQALLTAAAEFSKVADIVYVSNYTLNATTGLYERDPTIEYKPGPLGADPNVKYATGVEGDGFDADFFYWSYPGTPGPGVSLLGSMSPPDYGDEGTAQFNSADERWNAQMLQQGGFSFVTLIHEFGHGHGLAHPHDTGGGSSIMLDGDTASGRVEETTPFSYTLGDYDLNQGIYTVMSYMDGWQLSPYGQPDTTNEGYGWLGSLMAFDIAVIQDKYGVNEDWATGNDTYVLKDVNEWGVYIDAATGQPAEHNASNQTTARDGYYVGQSTYYSSIWDANGNDSIVYVGARNANIDLRQASLKYEYGGAGWVSYATGIYGGYTIANGVTIENAYSGSGNDTLIGNDAVNTLVGGGGSDTLIGYGGNDQMYGGSGNDSLDGGLGNDVLIGEDGNNVLIAREGNDQLHGGTSADLLFGGLGDDLYFIANSDGLVTEAANEGNDTIYTSVNYALAAGSEVEYLSTNLHSATTAINLVGNEFGNRIAGNAGANLLMGLGGADTLTGLGGNDQLYGGSGNDRLEGGTGNDILIGDDGDDTLLAGDGNDQLHGGVGSDQMAGGLGDDLYFISDAAGVIGEAASEGNDSAYSSVSYTLAAGAEVETLSTISHAATTAIDLAGNAFANSITGNAGANTLNGGGGNDVLTGLGGPDTYQFTTALGAQNVDTIVGFQTGVDKIALDDAVFTGLGLGALSANAFVTGTAAQDADDRIIYNQLTGALLFDADGAGGAAAVQFAQVDPGLVLGAGDFIAF